MKPSILLLFLAGIACYSQSSQAQGSYMDIIYEPDSCLQSDIIFSVNTNLTIENLIEWDFGDPSSGSSNTSDLGSPAHTFSDTGTFVVSCILQVNCGGPIDPFNPISFPCFYIDTIYTTIRIFDCESIDFCGVYFPNAFTPNNDGINETFGPSNICEFESYDLAIFNRWGQPVFQTSSPSKHWEGSNKGIRCATGVYTYVLRYKLSSKTQQQKSGRVILIR
ncbi:MAG: gliding motility-associated C-terminal domain-containing protein [Bacteroidota bacterium]